MEMAGSAVLWIGIGRDGCWWYRAELPRQYLAARGHDVRMTLAKGEDVGHKDDFGAVILQRLSYGPAAMGEIAHVIRGFQQNGTRVYYELDDNLWLNHMIRGQGPGYMPRAWRRAVEAQMDKLIALCDGVLVSTAALGGVISARCHRRRTVHVIPNAIPDSLCELGSTAHEDIRIGWMGSESHAIEGDFQAMLPALRRVLEHHPEAHAVFMGYHPPEVEQWPRTEWHGWVPIDDYYATLSALNLDLFVAPLADTAFNAAKSASKLMEAAALGLPILASPHGPYRSAEDLVSAYATTTAEWEALIGRLVRHPEIRRADGARARATVRARYTMEQTGPLWERLLCGVTTEPLTVG